MKLPRKTRRDATPIHRPNAQKIVKISTMLELPQNTRKMFKIINIPMMVPGKATAVMAVFNFQFFPPQNLKIRAETYPETVPLKT